MIRPATAGDAAAIAQVHLASWRTTYPGIVAQDYIDQLSIDRFVARWQSRLSAATDSSPIVLVGVHPDTGALVGFASAGRTRDQSVPFDAELQAIYLLKGAQGRGLGRLLVLTIAEHLLMQGYASLCVNVLADNPACVFYQRLGGVWLQDAPHVISEVTYRSSWYVWPDLHALAKSTR